MIIYPDDFSFADAGVGAMPFGANYAVRQIDADEWEALENVGCVFLPTTGEGAPTNTEVTWSATQLKVNYWTSNTMDANKATFITFHLQNRRLDADNNTGWYRYFMFPVRLVQDY